MWDKPLIEIKKILKGFDENLNHPVTDEEIAKFSKSIEEQLGNIPLPTQYLDFLKETNGLDFNGTVIYGVDNNILNENVNESNYGLIENNEIWYENEWQKEFLFIGDSNTSWYCIKIKENICMEQDKPSGSLIREYDDFNEMLEDALNTSLMGVSMDSE